MKQFKLLILDEAIDEIQEAIDWYEEQQAGIGKKFYTAINDQVKLLKRTPFFGIRYDQVRCIKVRRFPYLIHYRVDEATQSITVIGVLHTSLDPDQYWKTSK